MAPSHINEQSSSSNDPLSHVTLFAIYTNPSTSTPSNHQFSQPISAPIPATDSTSITDKTAYLSELRTSTKTLQDEVNVFLTQKMEEDKLHTVTTRDGVQVKKAGEKTTDEVEEENYGEEGVEDEEEG
jgi:hypothetical protein